MKKVQFVATYMFLLTLLSCESDTEILESTINDTRNNISQESTFLEKVELGFTLKDFDPLGNISGEYLEVIWDTHEIHRIENKDWYEFNISQQRPTTLEDGNVTDISYSLMVAQSKLGSPLYYITRFSSESGTVQKSYFDIEKDFYTGMIQMFDLKGDIMIMQYFRKGEHINTTIDVNNKNPKTLPSEASRCTEKFASRECTSTNSCTPPATGGGSCGGSGQGSYEFRYLGNEITDWWLPRGNGIYEYSHWSSKPLHGWVWVPSGKSGPPSQNSYSNYSFDGGAGSYLSSQPTNTVPPHVDVSNVSDPCIKTLIAKLRYRDINKLVSPNIDNIQGASHLSQTILEMFDGNPNYHINFKIEDATNSSGQKRNAYTTPRRNVPTTGQWTFDIVIDKNYVKNATRLAIARTVIHESLHAYLYYTTQTYSTASFTQLFYSYVSNKGYNTNTAQHNMMTEFADAIGHSLAVFDLNRQDQSYYNNLAWSGDMLNTSAFTSLSGDKQTAVENANKNEGNAVDSANSSAKGTKCP